MRKALSQNELAALEQRIRALLKDVPHQTTVPGGYRYFPVNSPSYCEAFGMLQALDALSLGTLSKGSTGKFDLRTWFDRLVDAILAERP